MRGSARDGREGSATPAPNPSPLAPLCLQRDGCPKIINLGSAKTDLFYERKKYGFKKR